MEENKEVSNMDTGTSSDSQETQSVITRVSNLPLVSTACDAVSNAYSSTKESVPVLRGVMDVAENGVRTLSTAASTGTKPLLDKLEPQLAMVNEYAIKGLDKMEEKLPILHQPADELVSKTVDKVYQCVSGAKEAVVGAVKGGVEMTCTALSGGINTVMGTRVGQLVSSGVGMALSRSENWVEQNLPLSEKELAALAEPLPQEEAKASLNYNSGVTPASSYFVRLGKLSSRVQERALELSLIKASVAREATHKAVSQITGTFDLLERLSGANKLVGAPELLLKKWKEWKQEEDARRVEQSPENEDEEGTKDNEKQVESRALHMVQAVSEQLREACAGVVSSVQGLPTSVQEQLVSARRSAEDLHASLVQSNTITPKLVQQSREQLTQVKQSLDGVMEYLVNNTPMNWLVGPFSPQLTEKEPGTE